MWSMARLIRAAQPKEEFSFRKIWQARAEVCRHRSDLHDSLEKTRMTRSFSGALACMALATSLITTSTEATENKPLDLGNFSISLAVKNLKASKAFYEKLGFTEVGGNMAQNWVVLQSGGARIGLFQGMFDTNLMTFNPGWGKDKAALAEFTDVRELQHLFKARGITPLPAADESTSGPAFFMIKDPDGNSLLFEQHVPSPKR